MYQLLCIELFHMMNSCKLHAKIYPKLQCINSYQYYGNARPVQTLSATSYYSCNRILLQALATQTCHRLIMW